MQADRREIARYLGYKNTQPDAEIQTLIEVSLAELDEVAQPRSCRKPFRLRLDTEQSLIDLGCFHMVSRNLCKNLQGCTQVVLFAATLGTAVDSLIHRYSIMEITRGVILQAAAAALIEAYCDEIQEQIRVEMGQKNLYLRPRFSPGYGDLPLSTQRDVVRVLGTAKEIGLTLTDDYLMVPMKSVTAIIGVSPLDTACQRKGCEICGKADCVYRRN